MPSELERLPNEVELSIFRIVQECLTNVHGHSGSPSAAIRITHEDHSLRIEIEDDGTGASRDKQRAVDAKSQTGVGIRGMRERLRRLNGTLEIGSNGRGTRVTATIPLQGDNFSDAARVRLRRYYSGWVPAARNRTSRSKLTNLSRQSCPP
jgi:two-component system NarL family sensor kinase